MILYNFIWAQKAAAVNVSVYVEKVQYKQLGYTVHYKKETKRNKIKTFSYENLTKQTTFHHCWLTEAKKKRWNWKYLCHLWQLC